MTALLNVDNRSSGIEFKLPTTYDDVYTGTNYFLSDRDPYISNINTTIVIVHSIYNFYEDHRSNDQMVHG
jgi:hypothetical protein